MTELEEILNKLDIGHYLDREGIDYKETTGTRGMQYNLRTCPVCGGDKWKVFIGAESGLGNCFSGSCDKKFNKFSFIQAHSRLAGKNLMEHIKAVGQEVGWRPARKSSVAMHLNTADLKLPDSFPLPINGQNLKYLQNRGFGLDIVKYMGLRYCLKGFHPYLKPDGTQGWQPFHKRIIIPVVDLDGNLVSFQGRDITGQAEKKYLFPTGYAVTGSHLYNGHNVRDTSRIVMNEGVFDVAATKIALDEDESLRDVVPIGSFGKHLSPDQIQKFEVLRARGVREVTIMWDGEVAALDDAILAGGQLKALGFSVRIALLPKDKDPNEVPPSVVRQAFYSALPLTHANAVKMRMEVRAR